MGWKDAPEVAAAPAWASAPEVGAAKAAPAKPSKPDLPFGMQTMADIGGGLVRGAGSIGATLLAPMDALNAKLMGRPALAGNQERRAGIDAAYRGLGVDTDSMAYGGGKLGGEIAGTAGIGPAAAGLGTAAVTRAAPAALPKVAPVLDAVRTSGMSAGGATGAAGLTARTVGGGATGYASTLAATGDADEANKGGAIGAALPGGVKAAAATGKAIGGGVTGILKHVLGLSTGVGAEPLSQAFKAGKAGNKDFLANMRGDVPIHDVLDRAKQGISAMVAEKSAQYRSGMIPVAGDKTVLNLSAIDKALTDAAGVTAYKGQVKNESAAGAVAKMRAIVDEWKVLDPAEFHTPEGLDALKQKLGGIMESIPFNERTARLAAGKVYTAAKATIEQQAPTYSKVMKDYAAASEQISEIERALSLGDKASKDTAMRKLQSLMRNNVQTNYGNRLSLANTLEKGGGVDLLPSLAGQAVSSMTPRSLAGQIGGGATALGAMMTGNPLALAALPFQSPRLVGSMAYGAGRMSGGAANALGGAQQGLLGAGANPLLGAPNALQEFIYRGAPVALTGRGQ